MINRRSVRIKTMQTIYAFECASNAQKKTYENYLEQSIHGVKSQYLYILLVIREIANFVEKDAQIKAKKFIKSTTDKNFNTKFLSNTFIQYLNHDEEFLKEIKQLNIQQFINEEEIRDLYKIFIETPEYNNYINNNLEFNNEEDKKIISFLFEKFLLENEDFLAAIEEHFINWNDDATLVVDAVQDAIKKSKNELAFHLEKQKIKSKIDELSLFGRDLFVKTIESKDECLQIIEPKLKNWDKDRLATIDVIILRMSITEFLEFPSIPTKVTINEYLDIAKEYSTPKSKDFINGILDKTMQELLGNGKIKKLGRGLV
jgi:N utilization substance protein B